jgi:hypothetical protein
MRILYVVSLLLAVCVSTHAQAQLSPMPGQTATDLESRFVKACVKDGDTEAYCRCDFAATREVVKDASQLEFIVALGEKLAGLPEDQQDAILKGLPPDQLQWLIDLAQQLEPVVTKCPDYKQR